MSDYQKLKPFFKENFIERITVSTNKIWSSAGEIISEDYFVGCFAKNQSVCSGDITKAELQELKSENPELFI